MAISCDWCIDYTAKTISHVDGCLNWDTGTGTVPGAGDYIMVTGSCKFIVMRTLVAFTGTCGTDAVTETVNLGQAGKIACGDVLTALDQVNFDGVVGCPQGFAVGDTVTGTTSCNTGIIRAIQYNCGTGGTCPCMAGEGTIWGIFTGGAWTCNEPLAVGGNTKALVNGVGVSDDWAGEIGPALFIPPGTNNVMQIMNFDTTGCCVINIPEEARIGSCGGACASETAIVEKHLGTGSCGTLITRCLGGAGLPWDNNDDIFLRHVIFYDTQVAGQVFSVGDVVTGTVTGAQARVLQVEDDGDCTGKIVTAGIVNCAGALTETAFNVACLLQVNAVTIATVEAETIALDTTSNVNLAVRTAQREDQGGILADATSLNIVRGSNQFFTFLRDTFDNLAQLDDQSPADASVKDGNYTLLNNWVINDLNFRFLSAGAWGTSDNNCIFTNYQTIGTVEDITDKRFFNDTTCPTPQPDIYVEQNGLVLRQDWLEGNIDIIAKTKTKTDTRFICATVATLGQNINCGSVTILEHSFLNTFDHFSTSTIGGVAPIPLNTANDLNCGTGQYRVTYTMCGGFDLGEEITGGTSGARGTVVAECLTCNTADYALKSTTQFAMCETVTGTVSAACIVINACGPANLVAGYCDSVRFTFAQTKATGGTVGGGKFQTGELVTQAVSCANGAVVGQNSAGTELVLEVTCGCFNCCGAITDDVGCSTYTPSAVTTTNDACIDLGDGTGNHTYNAAVGGCSDSACTPRSVLNIYNWAKFITRKEATGVIGKLGECGTTAVEGRIYINLVCSYPTVKASPFGTFAGGTMFGAQGLYIDKCCVPTACNQSMQLIDTSGVVVCPPNLQTISVTGLVACDSVAVFQTTAACGTCILRTSYLVGAGACDNQAADTTVVVAAGGCCVSPLRTDTPCCGVLRIQDPNESATTLEYLRFPFNAVNKCTNTFTLTSGTIGNVTCCNDLRNCDDIFVAFICRAAGSCTVSTCVQYCADVPLLVRVRKKGIEPFQTTGCFTSTGFSTGAIRATCAIVDLP